MSERRLTLADRKRLRDEAIVDFRHGFINRREFMLPRHRGRRLGGVCRQDRQRRRRAGSRARSAAAGRSRPTPPSPSSKAPITPTTPSSGTR